MLRAADLVAAQQHGNALRQQQRGQEVPPLPGAQLVDSRIVSRALYTAVPGAVVVGAVEILLAIRLVVLLVVAHQVGQREAIVAGDEVDAGVGLSAIMRV